MSLTIFRNMTMSNFLKIVTDVNHISQLSHRIMFPNEVNRRAFSLQQLNSRLSLNMLLKSWFRVTLFFMRSF